jgi:Zn-dependent protease
VFSTNMIPTLIVFQLIVLIFSIIIHEVSHGAMANYLGDPTARLQGRLSLNPLKHLDPIGSFAVPLFLWFATSGSFVFGWAKPVPFNPHNLRDQKYGEAKVAFAGPAANFIMALTAGLILRFLPINNATYMALGGFLSFVVLINLLLGIFNLIPIPPLDGSKILFTFLPYKAWKFRRFLQQYGLFILVAFIFLFSQWIFPLVINLYKLIVGHLHFIT